jgi:hypothetical protein
MKARQIAIMVEGTQTCDFAAISAALLEESVPALLFSEQSPQHLSQSQDLFWQNPNPFATATQYKESRVCIIEQNNLPSAAPVHQHRDFDTASLNHTSKTHSTRPATKPDCAWSRFRNLWFGCWERRSDARHQQLREKYLRSKKRRDSRERAKTADAVHKHLISIHKEKEERRNSEARRKAKEQKRVVQARKRRLKVATKRLKNAEKRERKESAKAAGITKTRSMVLWIEHKIARVLPKSCGIKSYDISGKRNT